MALEGGLSSETGRLGIGRDHEDIVANEMFNHSLFHLLPYFLCIRIVPRS